jgi:hypothetical protein
MYPYDALDRVRRTVHGLRGSFLCSIIEEFLAWTKTRINCLSGWTHMR